MSHQMNYDTLAIELGQVALQRDTYRDLCEELVQALNEICGVTDSPKAYKIALLAITKSEAILGGNNGTAN